MKNKIVLFDFFGVLSTPCYYPFIKAHINLQEQEYFISELDRLDIGNLTETDLIEILSKSSGINKNDILNEANTNSILNKELITYISKKLYKNIDIGLLTNIPLNILNRLFSNYLDLFSKQYVSSEIHLIKPNIEIFKYVINDLQMEAENIIFVDDSQKNIDVASSLGINVIHHVDNTSTIKSIDLFLY
jgi:putative hydrolase of the HAD superfamily